MTTIELSKEGANESRSVIKQFHACLNGSDLIPEQALRRNKRDYSLVCYINNIIGLFLSKNYEPIPIFVARAIEHMEEYAPTKVSSEYYATVKLYLSQMVYHQQNYIEGIEFRDKRVPKAILDAGPQQAPIKRL